jgi:hypothetical protein
MDYLLFIRDGNFCQHIFAGLRKLAVVFSNRRTGGTWRGVFSKLHIIRRVVKTKSVIDQLWAQSEGSPFSLDRAWGSAGRMVVRFSLTPLGLPGRFTIRLHARIPTTAREIIA